MFEGQGFRARAHHLVVVAAATMPQAAAPSATVDTAGLLPRASRRSLAGVDASLATTMAAIASPACKPPSARLRLGPELQQRQPEQQRQGLEPPRPRRPQVECVMPSEITVAQLFEAYYDCRRSKRTTRAALAFEVNLGENLLALLHELRTGTWSPSSATVFAITRPKPREVWAADFRDRIVHHLVYRAIAPLFEPSFIADSCACIPGRGTLYGANRLRRHLLSATENWTEPAFVLKADIANFFGSIRHADLFAMLAHRVKDATMLGLCRKLVFQDVRQGAIRRGAARHMALVPRHKSLFHTPPGTGLPIGNLSSQFFANVYLDGLDQMIKRRLRMRRYVRYVDDMVLVHPDPKELLRAADAIRDHLAGIGLALAESKTSIAPAHLGVDFVGQVIRPHRTIGRAKTHRAALHRLSAMPKEDMAESVNSYLGLFRHTGSRAQCAAIARLAHQRGLNVSKDLNKVAITPDFSNRRR